MPMWRCPHCATPQAEAARCWVCHRSTTACATCRHFRRSVAAHLGYCGLDRQRRPLRGNEIRACWESPGAQAGLVGGATPSGGIAGPGVANVGMTRAARPIALGGTAAPVLHGGDGTPVRKLEFVEVDSTRGGPTPPAASDARSRAGRRAGSEPAQSATAGETAPDDGRPGSSRTADAPIFEARWSLWGDIEA
jgi:hypothetical protein